MVPITCFRALWVGNGSTSGAAGRITEEELGELERALQKLDDLSAEEAEVVDAMTRSLVTSDRRSKREAFQMQATAAGPVRVDLFAGR